MKELIYPNGARFAFSIFDDAETGFVGNLAPVYRLFDDLGIKATKSVWVYPPRDTYTGGSLADADYTAFVQDLQRRGHEIGLHGVTSGRAERQDILSALERFEAVFGHRPSVHTNHASNPDNLYWGPDRFVQPFKLAYRLLRPADRSLGHDRASPHFWEDIAADSIRYIRHFAFSPLNTARLEPKIPYRVKGGHRGVYHWFSAADGRTVEEFTRLLDKVAVERAVARGGCSLVYTHLGCGFTTSDGRVDNEFARRLEHLAGSNVWFAPVSTILDYLLHASSGGHEVAYTYLLKVNCIWLFDRLLRFWRFKR